MQQSTSQDTDHEVIAAKPVKAQRAVKHATFAPIEQVTRPTLSTDEAAFYLNRRPQTLRCWALRDSGPVRCTRIHGRLAWPLAAIKTLLGVSA